MSNFARYKKSGTGDPLHTQEPVTVASFRTWRGWRERVARDRCLTFSILTFVKNSTACTAIRTNEPAQAELGRVTLSTPQHGSTQRALPFLEEITNNGYRCFLPSNNVPHPFFFP